MPSLHPLIVFIFTSPPVLVSLYRSCVRCARLLQRWHAEFRRVLQAPKYHTRTPGNEKGRISVPHPDGVGSLGFGVDIVAPPKMKCPCGSRTLGNTWSRGGR